MSSVKRMIKQAGRADEELTQRMREESEREKRLREENRIAKIDWSQLEKLARVGMNIKECADYFRMSPKNLGKYIKEHYGYKPQEFFDRNQAELKYEIRVLTLKTCRDAKTGGNANLLTLMLKTVCGLKEEMPAVEKDLTSYDNKLKGFRKK